MNTEQKKAAKSLSRALKKCAAAKIGVYCFEGSVTVCPIHGRDKEKWNESPSAVIADMGERVSTENLHCDGGSGW